MEEGNGKGEMNGGMGNRGGEIRMRMGLRVMEEGNGKRDRGESN